MIKKGLFYIASFFLYLVALLPFPVLYLLADLLYVLLFYVAGYRRRVVQQNLASSFPEKTGAELKKIEKEYYHFLADLILESLKMRAISAGEMKKRFVFTNPGEIQEHLAAGRSVLIATGHYGNWEWGTHALALNFAEKVLIIYKPLSSPDFGRWLNDVRARFGAILVAMKLTLRKIIEYKNDRFMAVFVSDQTPAQSDAQHFLTFLNQPTAVFLGIEKIAKMTNNPVVYCNIHRYKRGYYKATFKTLSNDPAAEEEFGITRKHTEELERVIRQEPGTWLWSHKRWKFKAEDIRP